MKCRAVCTVEGLIDGERGRERERERKTERER